MHPDGCTYCSIQLLFNFCVIYLLICLLKMKTSNIISSLLDINLILSSNMGNSLPNKTVEFKQLKTKGGVHVISASMQGWRQYMQDSCCIKQINEEVLFGAVYDGHGGPEVAQFLTTQLVKELTEDPYFKSKNYYRALVESFRKIDEIIGSEQGEKRLKNIQSQNSSCISKNKAVLGEQVGSTANVLLLTKQKIYLANIGDSRALLCRNGKGIPLSFDHKPMNPNEKDRIVKAGGRIKQNRINDGINISRSFGDFYFKSNKAKQPSEQMVISIPEIKEEERSLQADQYIVLASDGVWQRYLTNYQWFIQELNQFLAKSPSWNNALKLFLQSLLAKKDNQIGSGYDNMTIVLILLKEGSK